MQRDTVFRLSADEVTQLMAERLAQIHNLPSCGVTTNLTIATDGKSAELMGAVVIFKAPPKEG